ncbi:EAL domain-containing protein [Colwellia sp. MB02u-18]|nr:EAL domain-containing protein [Colwellia sp. MB3u-45]MBA6266491.1 EAL domain-containing protein [Colwellia sp. MB3u-43]MBA6320227.1 EAL domain-containing protein [Colwellia sp. MB02u-19]MBA6326038.1 EAL domain-containing protein [Colwellia sp. MB02u-18]MBA6332681.1 EAL domain-containing protein [Colwellia sp. MB02u-12]MBA6346367.1 EAL domain-containing protein [Colwellia sp. MB02u-1]
MLNKILSIVRKHLDMEVAFISKFINKDRVFKIVDSKNEMLPINVGDSDPIEESYCAKIVDNVLPNIIHNTKENDITSKLAITDKLSIGSYIGVPIKLSTGEIYGTFCCYKQTPDETLNQQDLSFLNAIADIASELIEKNVKTEFSYNKMKAKITSVLEQNKINIHYQPIFNFHSNKIIGYESLSRFNTIPYESPDIWFADASQVNLGEELEILAIKSAIKGIDEFNLDTYIAINSSPAYVLNGAVARALQGVNLERIILEITEHAPIENYPDFRKALEPLRKQGLRIAIDDVGSGYSSFQHVLELEADIIKLDITLTQNINFSHKKYLLAKALCAFSKAINCSIIAEGVETLEELNSLRELGVDSVQGYLLGRPMPIKDAVSYVKVF